jgi:hypothetical protein
MVLGPTAAQRTEAFVPVKSEAQWRLMAGIAHGWKPTRKKKPPSRAVAHEYVKHGKPKKLPKRKSLLSKGG